MQRRRALVASTAALLIFGCGALVYVLFVSLGPSGKANLNKARVPLRDLEQQLVFELDAYGYHFFILPSPLDRFTIFRLPKHWDAEYGLPDPTWGRAILPCDDFGFDAEREIFTCHDSDRAERWWKRLEWSADGRSHDVQFPDLERATWSIEGEYLVPRT